MVQEDQAAGLGHKSWGLYTSDKGFEVPPECATNPSTAVSWTTDS